LLLQLIFFFRETSLQTDIPVTSKPLRIW